MRFAATLNFVLLLGCAKPLSPDPGAQQVLDQCNRDGISSNRDPSSLSPASHAYVVTCMRESGWVLRTSDEACLPLVNGVSTGEALYNYAPCYARAPQ